MLALRVTALACEFGWSEEYICVWLSVSRAEQYYHALLRRAKWRTYAPPELNADEQAAALAQERGAHPAPWAALDPEVEAVWARFDAKG